MKLFRTNEAIISEIAAMTTAEITRREDRATVSAFYNGKPPLTDAEAEEIGLNINVNNLFGYTEISAAKDQAFGLYTKPTEIFSITINAAPSNMRAKWESACNSGINDVIKGSHRFKPAYEGICGDASLHGEAVLFHANSTDWCPSHVPLSKILVPEDAPTDVTQLTHWGIEAELSLSQLSSYSKGDLPGWKSGVISRILRKIYEDVGSVQGQSVDINNFEEMEYLRQRGGTSGESRKRPSLKVIYFYQVCPEKNGSPVDLTILVNESESVAGSGDKADDKVIFQMDSYFDSVTEILHPFFMDCTLGGEPKWNRVLGLGHLNYTLNFATEILVNRCMQGTIEGMMNLWQASDSATAEDVQRVVARHNGVIPENIKLIQQRFTPDFSGALSMVQFFRQQGSRNARQMQPNSGDRNDMLEVQANAVIGQMAGQTSTRTSNWYEYLDRSGEQIWARLVNPFIRPSDPGYSDAKKFQSRLGRADVPIYWLQPHNVKVRSVRILGDGDVQKEKAGAMWLSQNRAMFPPQAQQKITRMAAAAMTGSYELAEDLVPMNEQEDTAQVRIADDESNTCIVQGRSPNVSDADVDEVHVPLHLNAMTGIIQRASEMQGAAFTAQDFMAFKALGAHVVMHIQKVESMTSGQRGDKNKESAKLWMMGLNEIASVGEKFANNLKQQMEAGGEKPDPVEIAKLQLEAQKLQLSRDKFDFGVGKWTQQQHLRENESAFRRVMALEKDKRDADTGKRQAAVDDVKAAATIMKLQQPTA